MNIAWRRLKQENRKKLWRYYGWFTGLGCIGSCFGLLSTAVFIKYYEAFVAVVDAQALMANVDDSSTNALFLNGRAEVYTSQAHLYLMYSILLFPSTIKVLFAGVAKLIVLDRMARVAFSTSHGMPPLWAVAEHIVICVVVLLNVVACCSSVASTVYSAQMVAPARNLAASFAGNNTEFRFEFDNTIKSLQGQSQLAVFVTHSCLAAALIFTVATFLLVFTVCARRISHILRLPHADSDNLAPNLHHEILSVRRKIVGVVAFVFVAFVMMAFLSTLVAVSENGAEKCSDTAARNCDPCYNTFALIQQWITFTPEFYVLCLLMPSPLALLVALWGMTSDRMRQMLEQQGRRLDLQNIEWLK